MQRDKRFIVPNGREAVAEFVAEEMEQRGWSYGEIVRRSGNLIKSPSTLVNLVNGHVQTVSEDTLKGIANAFGMQPDRVFQIYYGKAHGTNYAEKGSVDVQQLPGGDYLIRLQPPSAPGAVSKSAKPRKPLIDVELPPEVAADLELMAHMFIDIPRECQLDSLASMLGIYQRRGISAKIHERHEARAETRAALEMERTQEDERPAAVRAASNITGPVRMTTPLEDYEKGKRQQQQKAEETGQKPDVPAKKQA